MRVCLEDYSEIDAGCCSGDYMRKWWVAAGVVMMLCSVIFIAVRNVKPEGEFRTSFGVVLRVPDDIAQGPSMLKWSMTSFPWASLLVGALVVTAGLVRQ
jgi:hypothetical protein